MVRVSPRSKPAPAAAEDSSMVYSYGHMLTLLAVIIIVFVCTIGGIQKQLPERQFGDVKVSGDFVAQKTIDTRLNGTAAATITLKKSDSNKLFLVDGTANNVVNLPALSTSNVGNVFEFFLTAAVGAGTTTTFVLPGTGVSNFSGLLQLSGTTVTPGAATNPVTDVAGDTLTLVNSTLVGARVRLLCTSDDGTNSIYKAETFSSPVATID